MARILSSAFCSAAPSEDATSTVPSSSTSILTPVSSVMPRITLPPGPIRSRMRSGLMWMVTMRGACIESSPRGRASGWFMTPRLWGRARRARALGERPVADLAPPGAAQELDLARAEGREVVVQHELLVRLANERIDLLLVGGGTERRDHERLRLAAREEGRTVRARQDLDLAGDGAHVGEPAAVEAALLLHDRLADEVLLQVIEAGGDMLQQIWSYLADARHPLVARLIERVVALLLAGLGERGAQVGQRRLAHLPLERGVDGGRRHAALGLADQPLQTLLQRDERLQRLVRGEERLEQQRLGDHAGAALDHDDRVAAARDDDVHVAGRELAGGRVDDEPAVQPPDAHGPHRAAPRGARGRAPRPAWPCGRSRPSGDGRETRSALAGIRAATSKITPPRLAAAAAFALARGRRREGRTGSYLRMPSCSITLL